ncbi:glycosyltransferase [Candidatus Parcubacteria bacterium]|nr:MAG: glycosyltransferase [Candidatus Parcubacteria bacterium]
MDNNIKEFYPLISVVTVSYNSEKYIEQTIISVISQSYRNIEYIIIDGGSYDGTLDIINKYQDNIDYWVSEKDDGIYDAINKGILYAHGDWIGLINSDDWYAQDAIEKVIESARNNQDVDIFYGNIISIDDGNKYRKKIGSHFNLFEEWNVPHPTCFVSRKTYKAEQYDPKYKVSGDFDYILRQYYLGKKFFHIDHSLVYFRRTGISNKPIYQCVKDRFEIRNRYSTRGAIKMFIKDNISYIDEILFGLNKKIEHMDFFRNKFVYFIYTFIKIPFVKLIHLLKK